MDLTKIALLALVHAPITAHALTVGPLHSSLQVDVVADFDGTYPPFDGPSPQIKATDMQSQGSTLVTLSVFADAESPGPAASASSKAAATAAWTDAASGSYTFDHTHSLGPGTFAGTSAGLHGANFTPGTGFIYAFSTDQGALLSIDFDLLGADAFQALVDGDFRALGGSQVGSERIALAAGSHEIEFAPTTFYSTDTIGGADRSFTVRYSGTLAWRLTPVPIITPFWLLLGSTVVLPFRRARSAPDIVQPG